MFSEGPCNTSAKSNLNAENGQPRMRANDGTPVIITCHRAVQSPPLTPPSLNRTSSFGHAMHLRGGVSHCKDRERNYNNTRANSSNPIATLLEHRHYWPPTQDARSPSRVAKHQTQPLNTAVHKRIQEKSSSERTRRLSSQELSKHKPTVVKHKTQSGLLLGAQPTVERKDAHGNQRAPVHTAEPPRAHLVTRVVARVAHNAMADPERPQRRRTAPSAKSSTSLATRRAGRNRVRKHPQVAQAMPTTSPNRRGRHPTRGEPRAVECKCISATGTLTYGNRVNIL